MLVDRKALKSVLFSSATLFGVVVGSAEDLQRRDQLKGIDLSYQDIDWKSNRDNGVTFAYIQATAGKGKRGYALNTRRVDTQSIQSSLTSPSGEISIVPGQPGFSLALTISPFLLSLLVTSRPISLLGMVEVGPVANPFRVPYISKVRNISCQPPCLPQKY